MSDPMEIAYEDGHKDGYSEGMNDANAFASEVVRFVLSWLNERDLLLPADFADGVTAQDIVDTLEEHERECLASNPAAKQ